MGVCGVGVCVEVGVGDAVRVGVGVDVAVLVEVGVGVVVRVPVGVSVGVRVEVGVGVVVRVPVGVSVGVAVRVGVGVVVRVGVDVGVLVDVGRIALDVGVGTTALASPPITIGRYPRGSSSCAARPAVGLHPDNIPKPNLPAANASKFNNSRLVSFFFIITPLRTCHKPVLDFQDKSVASSVLSTLR